MKIIHLIDSAGIFGAEKILLSLAQEQLQRRNTVIIGSIGNPDIKVKEIEIEGIKIGVKIKKFRIAPGLNIKGALQILKYIKSINCDIIHSHGYKSNILIGGILRNFHKIPIVATLHGWTYSKKISKMGLYALLDSICIRLIDKVVLVDEGMKNHLLLRKSKNLTIIENGIDSSDRETNLDINIEQFCGSSFVIGSVGRLSEEKGYQYLIKAIKIVKEKGIDCKALIIGDGDQKKDLEKLCKKLDLHDTVLLPGYKNRVEHSIKFFDVYVISSFTEGLPLTLLEAMKACVPIVATRVGAIPRVLENGKYGLLSTPYSADSLAENIIKVFRQKKKMKAVAETAQIKMFQKYTSKVMARKYNSLYEKILYIKN